MIEFTDHVLRKMKQRNLRRVWITNALKDPDYIESGYGNRKISYKKLGRLYLAVVYVKETKAITVITAHWDKEFKPPKEKN